MKKIILISFSLLFLFCSYKNPLEVSFFPILIFHDNFRIMWYEDSLFENWILPSAHVCDTQNGIIVTLFPGGSNDYTCTDLPDTFWGIIDYTVFKDDSLICFDDTCWAINDTHFYCMDEYLDDLFNAICNENAQAYTKKEINYTCSEDEDTVSIFNNIFDTTFYYVPSFYLPKLPLDSSMGFFFVSFDTVFCSEGLIDSLDGFLDFESIQY